jgi:hypothetical protein
VSHDNNILIGSVAGGGTVNIDQRQATETKHIEYTVAQDSVEWLPKSQVYRGVFAFYASLSLPVLAVVANALGVLAFFGVQTRWVLFVVIPLALIGAFLSMSSRKLAETAFRPNEAQFINGRWVERDDDGNYLLYRKTAPCIYPKCSGTVFIRPAPPREVPNHTSVGVCDVGSFRHTYTVDFNGIGYPHQFDWRPMEESRS